MSRRERVSDQIQETRGKLYSDQNALCWWCHLPMAFNDFELAHRVPQRRWCLDRWGAAAVQHPRNLVATHSGYCNARAQLDPESAEAEVHMQSIRKEIRFGKTTVVEG